MAALTLDEIDEAIRLVLATGKSVSIGDRSYTSHDLEDLYKLRALTAAHTTTGHPGSRLAATRKGV